MTRGWGVDGESASGNPSLGRRDFLRCHALEQGASAPTFSRRSAPPGKEFLIRGGGRSLKETDASNARSRAALLSQSCYSVLLAAE
jgi:hypothetical protein